MVYNILKQYFFIFNTIINILLDFRAILVFKKKFFRKSQRFCLPILLIDNILTLFIDRFKLTMGLF